MTLIDYTGFSSTSLASLPTTHLSLKRGPMVSEREAKKESEEMNEWLKSVKKLSLVVDLDQTVVQATVDPSVGVWRKEGREWERKVRWWKKERERQKERGGEEMVALPIPDELKNPPNPNYPFLKDVKSFKLALEGPGAPPITTGSNGGGNGSRRKKKDKDKDKGREDERQRRRLK